MPSIQFWFAGVCTFFENWANYVNSPVLPPIHRMVLVNGSDPNVIPYPGILPHIALLTLTEPFSISGPMPPLFGEQPPPNSQVYLLNNPEGAYTISVVDPVPQQSWVFNAACLPNLENFVQGGNLGPPSLPVIEGGNAACYVDFQFGIINGFTVPGIEMGISVATVVTSSLPAIQIQGPTGTATVTFEAETAQMCLTNKPTMPGADNPQDFFLNFITCQTPPPEGLLTTPQGVGCTTMQPSELPSNFGPLDAGPGCSNTNFP